MGGQHQVEAGGYPSPDDDRLQIKGSDERGQSYAQLAAEPIKGGQRSGYTFTRQGSHFFGIQIIHRVCK